VIPNRLIFCVKRNSLPKPNTLEEGSNSRVTRLNTVEEATFEEKWLICEAADIAAVVAAITEREPGDKDRGGELNAF
jgi:hypothetical protein